MNEKILVVDDEESLRLSMKFKLKAAGFDVDVAEDGEVALEKLKTELYDVVLLDINMPRMSGIEALGLIRQRHPQTEAIMLTGFADFTTAIECLKTGARDYLVKPIDTTELVTRLRSLLRSRSSEKALQEVQQQYTSVFLHDMLEPLAKVQELIDRAIQMSDRKERTKVLSEARATAGIMSGKLQRLVEASKTTQDNPVELAAWLKSIRNNGL
jgi:DNA-binding response OmpR family regulator